MDLSRDFDAAHKSISAALVSSTRTAGRISAEDVSFLRSSFPLASQAVHERSSRLLSVAEKLLLRSTSSQTRSHPRLPNVDAVETSWRKVVDVVDSLLERADITLDEYAGYFRKRNDDSREQSPASKKPKYLPKEFRTQNIAKPQLLFEHKPFNHQTEPFKPLILTKPHANVSLDVVLAAPGKDGYQHPYQLEIEAYQYPSFVQNIARPIDPKPFESTNAIFVEDMVGVRTMLATLRQANAIAIDLEHHDTHSYIGMVSLMQISTRDNDWIVDTLKPWRRELQVLNEVFADPCIIKVLHGAQMDAIWLQRDLGLYLVGLFDTYHAARALGYTGHGLAFLLKKFVDFDAQKQYQTADWRIRPLPTELFEYARSDTHFLLYIYDNMRNELKEQTTAKHDKLQDVLNKSKEYALQRYEHPLYCDVPRKSTNGWFNLLCKTPANFTDLQLAVFRKVHLWRDAVGRAEDESVNHVMANHVLHNIARAIPIDKPSLLRATGNISPIVRSKLEELVHIIASAQADPDMAEKVRRALDAALNNRLLGPNAPVDPASGDGRCHSVTAPSTKLARTEVSRFWGHSLNSGNPEEGSSLSDRFGLTLSRVKDCSELIAVAQEPAASATRIRKIKTSDPMTDSVLVSAEPRGIGNNPAITGIVAGRNDVTLRVKLKAESMLMKQQVEQGNVASESDAEIEPFDYESAPFILRDDHRGPRREKKSQRPAFNPYATAAETSSGLGRVQNFRTGRTTTFK